MRAQILRGPFLLVAVAVAGCLLSLWSTVCPLVPVHGHPWRGEHDLRTIGGEFLFCPLLVVHPVPPPPRLLAAVLLLHGGSGEGDMTCAQPLSKAPHRVPCDSQDSQDSPTFTGVWVMAGSAPKRTGRHRSGTFHDVRTGPGFPAVDDRSRGSVLHHRLRHTHRNAAECRRQLPDAPDGQRSHRTSRIRPSGLRHSRAARVHGIAPAQALRTGVHSVGHRYCKCQHFSGSGSGPGIGSRVGPICSA